MPTPYLPLQLCILWVSYSIGGFYLTACQANPLVWLLTGMIILYLADVGTGGLLLANLWAIGLLLTLTFTGHWPVVPIEWLPVNHSRIWAAALLALWGLSIVLILALAFSSDACRSQGWKRWQRLMVLGLGCWWVMGLGYGVYQFAVS